MGYKSIKAYRNDNPYYATDDIAYTALLGEYNYIVDTINEAERRYKEDLAEKERQRVQQEKEIARQEKARQQAVKARKVLYLVNFKTQVKNAERTNTKTTIPIDMVALNGDFDALLAVLNPRQRKYMLQSGNTYYAMNSTTIPKLRALFENPLDAQFEEFESGNAVLTAMKENEPFELVIYPEGYKGHFGLVDGAFFPYTHNLNIDLSRYSVFRTGSNFGDAINQDNCLITAFSSAGFDTTMIKAFVKNQYVPKRCLPEIAEKLKVYIVLKMMGTHKDTYRYGDKSNPIINLGLLESHYFLIEPTEYTSYSITNFFDIYTKPNWKLFYKEGRCCHDGSRFIDSFKLISLLLENKATHLKELDGVEIYKLIDYKNREPKIFSSLHYNDAIRQFSKKTFEWINEDGDLMYNTPLHISKSENMLDVVFFDFETTTTRNDKTATIHKPYCCFTDQTQVGYWGDDCGKQMLDDLVRKYGTKNDTDLANDYLLMVAHNSGYDFRFILSHAYRLETIEKGTGLMCASFIALCGNKKLAIRIRDSLKMINMGLGKFGETFGLNVKKELMPYDLYTEENVSRRYLNVQECMPYIKPNDVNEFLANCRGWGCIDEDEVIDILDYSGRYCYMDCITLRDGYNKFRDLVEVATKQDIRNYLTLASMSNDYLVQQGCYDGVLKLCGVPRAFIQKCIVGGRTMCAENKAHHVEGKILNDFDAVSLYPTAMARMEGFLIGKPKIIKTFAPEKYSGYFICIKITKVGIDRHFPLLSYKTDKDIRQFSNNMVGEIVYIDKVGLEDAIKFQQIEYEFINGYYYDEGHNTKINDVMKYLFTQRKKYKDDKSCGEDGNPLQLVFKELMNSGYGKAYMKPIDSDNKYVSFDDMDLFVDRNYNSIKEAVLLANGKTYKVSVSKQIDKHYNNAHVGVEILSMSKRIMNEVMCLAEDMGQYLYYQDTDSIHIENSHIDPLAKAFKAKYGRELIGKAMGQFHSDFKMEGTKKHADIFAVESIFLGKKCYIDKLKSVNDKDETIYDYHIRMKGVPNDSIKYKAEHDYENDIMKIYKKLYEGTKITFNLIAVKPKFELCKNMNIITKPKFDREIGFNYGADKTILCY